MEDTYNKEVCKLLHKNVEKDLDSCKVKIEKNENEIKDVQQAIIVLTGIATKLEKAEEYNRKEIKDLYIIRQAEPHKDFSNENHSNKSKLEIVLSQKWFGIIVTTICALTVLIVGSAIGRDYFNNFLEIIGK